MKQWFAAHIPTLPEIQARARAELDSVCGRDRLPTADDEAKMPYIHAIVKARPSSPLKLAKSTNIWSQEIERCHNPFWLGTPHMNTEDFTYKGYFIPKDTVIVLNTVCRCRGSLIFRLTKRPPPSGHCTTTPSAIPTHMSSRLAFLYS